SYDAATDTWGAPEVVMAYAQIGKSCAFPSPSPDGRYVLHILADKGTYPVTEKTSQVHLFDLVSGQHRDLEAVSSPRSESFPRWSTNGRWISLVSNRGDGRTSLPYFAYFDTAGQAHKAFVLPQEDPSFYDTFTDTYNILEMVRGRVPFSPYEIARGMQLPAQKATFANPPPVDAQTRATRLRVAQEAGGR
ncbi:MAG: hypothetical protein AB1505_34245, partial [Candidatus Latescibacterota bacterium]